MLRLASLSDLAAVFQIYMHPKVVPYLGYDAMPLDDFRPIFTELVRSETFYVWQAEGEVRGFCRALRHVGRAAHSAYLGTFAVHPDEQGTGLARTLLQSVIARLQAQGVLRVELSMEEDNARALAFYQRLGFVQEGVMRAAYRRGDQAHYLDELMFAKLLAPLPK